MREKILFDKGWMFHRGDLKPEWPTHKTIAYRSAKTERYLIGPAAQNYHITDGHLFATGKKEFKSENWQPIDLPHDYLAGDTPDPAYNQALGFCKYDNAWYVKRFEIPAEDKGRRLTLLFDGVATHATVTLNGSLLKHNFCGYTPFEVDITDMAKYGEENVISVYVNTEHHEGWWYEGAGIYRHVWLIKTDPVAVDLWGIFARPEQINDTDWRAVTEVTVRNDTQARKSVRLVCELLDAEGNTLATEAASGMIDLREKRTFTCKLNAHAPRLWSPDDPYQHSVRVTVFCGKRQTDVYEVRFGFRSILVDNEKGLFINGKHYLIKGACVHENCGYTGKAVPDNIQRYRVKLLREMGANGYRTAHYPHSEAIMDALDENGFIVMNETRWFESTDEGKEQLSTLVRRDRNRPSVIFWSIGNEEPLVCSEQGVRICRSLVPVVKKLDPSRPVMTAITHSAAIVYDEVDVVGLNYLWKHVDAIREKIPHKPVMSSECGATGTTRGWYYDDDPTRGFINAYDHDTNTAFISRENTWKRINSYPWMMGGYQWTGFEYRGEAMWPRLCSQSGAIDLYLQKKDAFYQNRSHWSDEPMVHLLPHWNFVGREGEPIRVLAYTNQPQAELFLNGVSQGVREIERFGHAEWLVPFASGVLEVRAGANGQVLATDRRQTSKKAAALKLILDTKDLAPDDTAIVTCIAVDEDGVEVPDACPTVSFMTSGAAKVFSTGGAVNDHASIFSPDRKMWMGRVGVALKLASTSASATLYATSDSLASASLTVEF